MIRHVVAFRFRDEVDGVARRRLLGELADLPLRFPDMSRFALGDNRSDRDDRFEYAFSVEFADFERLGAYLHSDEHERFVQERFRPLIAERAIVSFEPTTP